MSEQLLGAMFMSQAQHERSFEARSLAEQLIRASTPHATAEAICEIESFVCHVAREVDEGQAHQDELDSYADCFSDLFVAGKRSK